MTSGGTRTRPATADTRPITTAAAAEANVAPRSARSTSSHAAWPRPANIATTTRARPGRQGGAEDHQSGSLRPHGAGVEGPDVDPEHEPDAEPGGHAPDDPGGREERVQQPRARGDREAGDRVLRRAHHADPGEEHHDPGGDDP